MPDSKTLFIGLMSGTSMDGIDAVVVDFSSNSPHLLASHQEPIPNKLQKTLRQLAQPGDDGIDQVGAADIEIGRLLAKAVNNLLHSSGLSSDDIIAIGSHGQTIRHRPDSETPFTLQIGDPNTIAQLTGITTIADFRRRDMAAGGQGAPLVPAVHANLFQQPDCTRVVLNIGGIANITLLPADGDSAVIGYDTGPGNTLMDSWCRQHINQPYDANGEWAASGQVIKPLLESMLADPYFKRPPPKSSGPEYFSPNWLQQQIATLQQPFTHQEIQTTLLELTAQSISQAIQQHHIEIKELLVCGGGVHNQFLMQRLAELLKPTIVSSTADSGVEPDWLEALAFAWLAYRTLNGLTGNLPDVTGADSAVVLGGIYLA
jgi:anhydro-N-acetylmuramic acid kinase